MGFAAWQGAMVVYSLPQLILPLTLLQELSWCFVEGAGWSL